MAETWTASDFVGGRLCLDLANTIENRVDLPKYRDKLASPADLLSWLDYAKMVHEGARFRFANISRCDPEDLDRVIRLREAIFRTFSAVAARLSPPAEDVNEVCSAFARGSRSLSIAPVDNGIGLSWDTADGDPDSLLAPLSFSAATLLLGDEISMVKQCEGCGWLFLDTSKNGRRRWCDMKTCGNRAKVNKHRTARAR